jgi:methenyltetrahydromethanopterin cyclohydrolase
LFIKKLNWLLDTEVFQLKASAETDYKSHENSIVINYQVSQATLQYSNARENLFQFLINLCAIVGGVFTIARILDTAVHKTSKVLFKHNINKLQ